MEFAIWLSQGQRLVMDRETASFTKYWGRIFHRHNYGKHQFSNYDVVKVVIEKNVIGFHIIPKNPIWSGNERDFLIEVFKLFSSFSSRKFQSIFLNFWASLFPQMKLLQKFPWIKFSKFRQKDILLVRAFFWMRLKIDFYKVNQKLDICNSKLLN